MTVVSDDGQKPGPPGATVPLKKWQEGGDQDAKNEFFTMMYPALLNMARQLVRRERAGFEVKMEAQDLLHKAYARIRPDYPIETPNRVPFIVLMKHAMDHVLKDQRRHDVADKHVPTKIQDRDTGILPSIQSPSDLSPEQRFALDKLRAAHPQQARVLELKEQGYTSQEIAEALGIGRATVTRDLAKARRSMAIELGLEE
jgi:RNA polymerase sigma factor (sigma-70 family)